MAPEPEKKQKLDKMLSKVGDLNFRRRVLKMLDYLDIQDGDHILDIGCGEGFYTMLFTNLYDCRVTAVDYDEKIMSMAQKWLEGEGAVTFEKGDITNLRFDDNKFDKIVCSEVLEHISDDKQAVKELYRVLKPGGILASTVPNKNYPFLWDPLNKIRETLGLGHFSPLNGFWGGIWAYDHKRLYLPADMKNLLEKDGGFKVEKLETLTHWGVPFNHLVLYVGKSFYSSFPVPEEVRASMEKFEWDDGGKNSQKQSITGKLMAMAINSVFGVLKWADSFNEEEFDLDTSTMAVAAKAIKRT